MTEDATTAGAVTDGALPTRRLGDLEVSALGFGAMVLSPGVYGDIDDERAERALLAAADAGATFFDTSDGYGADGHNERLVGRALRARRDEVVLATKFGFRLAEGAEPHPFPVGFAFGELAVNADPRYVRGYAEASLRELGTDRSTCTTRTSRTRRCRWRTPWAPWPSWSRPGSCGTSGSPT